MLGWSPWRRWWYAAKPASWPKLIVPMLLGQAIGVAAQGGAVAPALAWGLVFTVLDLLAIVFLNDWGDRHVDTIKRRRFPEGCSPKTIPDGILSARSLLVAGAVSALALVAWSFAGAHLLARPYLGWAGLGAALLFQIYTFGPLRLNYRGGGELVEMLGVGIVLPWVQAYAQAGVWWSPSHLFLAGLTVLSLGSALASGLSDEESDREGGKTTFVTQWGNAAGRRAVLLCCMIGAASWLLAPLGIGGFAWAAAIPACAVVLYYTLRMQRVSPQASTNAFAAQGRMKAELHRAIWGGANVLSVVLVVMA